MKRLSIDGPAVVGVVVGGTVVLGASTVTVGPGLRVAATTPTAIAAIATIEATAADDADAARVAAQLAALRVDTCPLTRTRLGRDGIAQGVEVEVAHGATSNCFRNAASPARRAS